jgi:glycosyltransferase involved in cell wall biosynthesis
MPRASVIIPVYNQPDRLALTLASLSRQTCDMSEVEVIVVDDGSTEDVAAVVSAAPLPVRYWRQENRGRAGARNAGISLARGPVLIFLDADLLVDPAFVGAHLEAHRGEEEVVIGRLLHFPAGVYEEVCRRLRAGCSPSELADLACEDMYLRLLEAVYFDEGRRRLMPWICAVFSNTSVRREALERAGGFDEGFTGWGLEDIELGYRLFQQGCRFRFLHRVTSYHLDHQKDENRMIQDMVRNIKRFYARHPAPEIALYRRFAAGFVSLEMLERAYRGADITGERPGPDDTLFRPIAYSQMKS